MSPHRSSGTIGERNREHPSVRSLRTLANPGIVKSVIALARHLGFAVIAEGIGTRKQERQLRALRCDYAQGYCYAKPLDSHAAARFLIKEQVAQPDEGYGRGAG